MKTTLLFLLAALVVRADEFRLHYDFASGHFFDASFCASPDLTNLTDISAQVDGLTIYRGGAGSPVYDMRIRNGYALGADFNSYDVVLSDSDLTVLGPKNESWWFGVLGGNIGLVSIGYGVVVAGGIWQQQSYFITWEVFDPAKWVLTVVGQPVPDGAGTLSLLALGVMLCAWRKRTGKREPSFF